MEKKLPGNDEKPTDPGAIRLGLVALVMTAMIRLYQLTLSSILGRSCRHLPSCSEYSKQAIVQHGAWAGFWLGLYRISRCHPWGTHGIDNVPETVPGSEWRFWKFRQYGQKNARDTG